MFWDLVSSLSFLYFNLLIVLLSVVTDVDNLQDVVVGAELQSSNVDLNVLLQEIFGQLTHLFGPSGAPH